MTCKSHLRSVCGNCASQVCLGRLQERFVTNSEFVNTSSSVTIGVTALIAQLDPAFKSSLLYFIELIENGFAVWDFNPRLNRFWLFHSHQFSSFASCHLFISHCTFLPVLLSQHIGGMFLLTSPSFESHAVYIKITWVESWVTLCSRTMLIVSVETRECCARNVFPPVRVFIHFFFLPRSSCPWQCVGHAGPGSVDSVRQSESVIEPI